MRATGNLLVVGSLNIDYIASVDRLPGPGETVSARNLIQRFGGKGANQAVAAARQGARVAMIGCVGDDDNGRAYRGRLAGERVDAGAISTAKRALTGSALIAVDRVGENLIIVAPGANGHLRPNDIRKHSALLENAQAVLLQFEVPLPTVVETVRLANRASIPVVLNPSPWREGFPWGKLVVDSLIVNAVEAGAVLGAPFSQPSARVIRSVRQALERKGIRRLIVTRGARSTLCISRNEYFEIPALRVKPVDTVGAGDAFAGAFCAARAEGFDVRGAIRLANCAGALATLKPGAQESIPNRSSTRNAAKRLAWQRYGRGGI